MESKFNLGDKFVRKGTRDSSVICIERIFHHFGQEPTYEIKLFGRSGNRQFIVEKDLEELYSKI